LPARSKHQKTDAEKIFIKVAARHKNATVVLGKLSKKLKQLFGLKNICFHSTMSGLMAF